MVIIIVKKMEAAKEQAESIPEHPEKPEEYGLGKDHLAPEATVLGVPVRRLQPVATVVFITVLGVASFFYFRPRTPREGKETIRTECYTSGCQELRLFLESTVNRSVDPCRDFFSFTCAAPLKQERLSQMSDDVRAAVTAMVTAANVSGEGQSAFEKAVATYRACVSLYSQNRSEAEELGSFLTGLGLNVADPNSNHDPLDVIVQLNLAWNLAPIVAINEAGGSRMDYPHEMCFSTAETEWYAERQQRVTNETYEEFIERNLRFLLPSEDASYMEEIKGNITSTETKVVNYLLDQFKAASDDDTPQYLIRVIDVPEYLDNVVTTEQWEAMVLRHSDQAYRMDDQLALEPLVARLTVFLLTELGSVDLMRLISWSVLRQLAPYADGEANGGTLNEIRDVCYDDVAEVLEPALTSKYIYKRLTPDVLREATYMGYRVRHSIMKTVGESSWLPPDARNAARRKAEAMRLIIAFPFNLTRLSALERLYANLPDVPLTNTSTGQMGGRGTGRSYVLSWLNASRFQRRIAIRYPTEIFFWLGTVNAQHTYSTNTVNLAGALLEPVIYYPGASVAYNYGGLGQLMGHEMMHGFDVTGRLYDEHGAKSNWWPKEATKVYTEQTSCLRSIHRLALKKRSLALNPMDSEDLADDMGVRVAFNALRNITGASERGGTRKVAGFSELQLFFLGHCAKMCDPRVPPRERDSSKPYAPNWARCVVPLMNMPEFADAFQCASGTLMNPERKCQFW